jgi:hypothetical protein
MFAVLLSEGMKPFYQIVASFPTIFFTVLLIVVVIYWLFTILGVFDISLLDFDIDISADGDISSANALTGLMMRFGLHGVPVTIIISLIVLFGWLLCYYLVYFLSPLFSTGLLRLLLGLPALIGSLYVAVLLTSFVIKPLRPFFHKTQQETIKRVLGQVAIVRSSVVNAQFGEVSLADGGAGLILKARTMGATEFHRGDRVVLLEYVPEQYVYRVISEQEFLGTSSS